MKLKLLFVLITIVLLSSCNSSQKITSSIQQDPSYSFWEGLDLDTTSLKYLMRMKKYEAILEASPVPVYVLSVEDFASEIFLKINEQPFGKMIDISLLGMYLYEPGIENYPDKFIFINKALTPEQKVGTYFHEVGHYYHMEEKCEECATNVVSRESHAFYNELRMGWGYDTPYVLESSIKIMAMYIINGGASKAYRSAALEIVGTSLWTQVMKYLFVYDAEGLRP